MKKAILGYVVLILLISTCLVSARTEEKNETVEINGAKEIVLNGDMGAGEFNVTTKDISEALTAQIIFDPRRVENDVDSYVKRDKCYITLESDYRRKFSKHTEDNIWEISLSNRYPISFNLDMGACESNMDLGGLPLKEFDLDFGAASGNIDFSKVNPERLRNISIDAGACDLEISNIGNANFDLFEFDGGVGSFELDFRGDYTEGAEITIELGLGSMDLILPKNIPVRIENEDDNWLSSVDIHTNSLNKVGDNIYESDDFDGADVRIVVNVEVGLGSVDIYFK